MLLVLAEAYSYSSYSVQSPILVNRGWVPRSWRDKSLKVSQDDKQSSVKAPKYDKESEKSSWWRFWSKKPTNVEVVPLYIV